MIDTQTRNRFARDVFDAIENDEFVLETTRTVIASEDFFSYNVSVNHDTTLYGQQTPILVEIEMELEGEDVQAIEDVEEDDGTAVVYGRQHVWELYSLYHHSGVTYSVNELLLGEGTVSWADVQEIGWR